MPLSNPITVEHEAHIVILIARRQDNLVWNQLPSIMALKQRRMEAMHNFLQDYSVGMDEGRYRNVSLSTLPLAKASFDLALCSHFLFLYSEQLVLAFVTYVGKYPSAEIPDQHLLLVVIL